MLKRTPTFLLVYMTNSKQDLCSVDSIEYDVVL